MLELPYVKHIVTHTLEPRYCIGQIIIHVRFYARGLCIMTIEKGLNSTELLNRMLMVLYFSLTHIIRIGW